MPVCDVCVPWVRDRTRWRRTDRRVPLAIMGCMRWRRTDRRVPSTRGFEHSSAMRGVRERQSAVCARGGMKRENDRVKLIRLRREWREPKGECASARAEEQANETAPLLHGRRARR